jgi:hypothetical protein
MINPLLNNNYFDGEIGGEDSQKSEANEFEVHL